MSRSKNCNFRYRTRASFGDSGRQRRPVVRIISDQAAAAFIIAAAAAAYAYTFTFPEVPKALQQGMGPERYPQLVLAVLVGLCVLLAIQTRGKAVAPLPAPRTRRHPDSRKRRTFHRRGLAGGHAGGHESCAPGARPAVGRAPLAAAAAQRGAVAGDHLGGV